MKSPIDCLKFELNVLIKFKSNLMKRVSEEDLDDENVTNAIILASDKIKAYEDAIEFIKKMSNG